MLAAEHCTVVDRRRTVSQIVLPMPDSQINDLAIPANVHARDHPTMAESLLQVAKVDRKGSSVCRVIESRFTTALPRC